MGIFFKKINVPPSTLGALFHKHRFQKLVEPGIYGYFDPSSHYRVVLFPTYPVLVNIVNQEVMTKDNISLRMSYFIQYRILDPQVLMKSIDLSAATFVNAAVEAILHSHLQIMIRKAISQIGSEELNEKRDESLAEIFKEYEEKIKALGIAIETHAIKDILFPKPIQDLFAKTLEARIRSKSELENARTVVATARALKNATDISKDGGLQFFQLLETLNKIGDKGKLTLVLGDITKLGRE